VVPRNPMSRFRHRARLPRRKAVERLALQRGVWPGAQLEALRCRDRVYPLLILSRFAGTSIGQVGTGSTILTGVSRAGLHAARQGRPGSTRRARELPNKEMKLTSVERIGRSQLISSVRRTLESSWEGNVHGGRT